jgi:polyribonucleotide nucleotidyltransferase
VLAATGASFALLVSDIPFDIPIAEVRVTRVNGELIVNPTFEQIEKGDYDITIAGTLDSIAMVEGEGKEISETDLIEGVKFAHTHII